MPLLLTCMVLRALEKTPAWPWWPCCSAERQPTSCCCCVCWGILWASPVVDDADHYVHCFRAMAVRIDPFRPAQWL